jgi:hypothetical protein
MAQQKITLKTHKKRLEEAKRQAFKDGADYGRRVGKDYIRKALRALLDIPSNKDLEEHLEQYHTRREEEE